MQKFKRYKSFEKFKTAIRTRWLKDTYTPAWDRLLGALW